MTPAEAAARPRIEGEREQEILDATLDVLAEVGYDKLTMDAVAAAAKASKATLYRRWETKASLVLDAFISQKGPLVELPDTGTLRGDLIEIHCGHGGIAQERQLAIFSAVLTALGRDPEFAERYRSEFLAPRIARNTEVYRRAQARGEVRDDVDIDLVSTALPGIVLHRQFVLGLPATPDSVIDVIDRLILPSVLTTPEKES